jgi:cysteine desulfurase/selenocysteine lyase
VSGSAYLNQAGTSWPIPAPVVAAVTEALGLDPARWEGALHAQQSVVASWLGLPSAELLRFTPGGTSALAAAVATVEWSPGERAVSSSMEHAALSAPLADLALRGVPRSRIPRSATGPIDLVALEAELSVGDIRLVAVTAVASVTGERLPIEDIVELSHEYGALCLIDASQLVGWERTDLLALDADLVAFAGHKALHGVWGLGVLYAADPHPLPSWCDLGSCDRAALAGLAAATRWLDAPAQRGRLARANQLADQLVDALRAQPGVVLHGRDAGWHLPIVAFTVRGRRPADLSAALAAEGVLVSGGQQCAPEAHEALGTAPDGVVRVSFGASSTEQDLRALLDGLAALI